MQNYTIYIAAGLVLFGLMGACAPTSPKPAILTNMEPALAALSYSWKTDYAAVLAPPVAGFSKKRMPPVLNVNLIAPLLRHFHLRMIRQ